MPIKNHSHIENLHILIYLYIAPRGDKTEKSTLSVKTSLSLGTTCQCTTPITWAILIPRFSNRLLLRPCTKSKTFKLCHQSWFYSDPLKASKFQKFLDSFYLVLSPAWCLECQYYTENIEIVTPNCTLINYIQIWCIVSESEIFQRHYLFLRTE